MCWSEMGGQSNGFEMRLKPSTLREGSCSEVEERVSREKMDNTLYKNSYVSFFHM